MERLCDGVSNHFDERTNVVRNKTFRLKTKREAERDWNMYKNVVIVNCDNIKCIILTKQGLEPNTLNQFKKTLYIVHT